jgi:ABC-type uncharacterized transport system auxiliary subunit
LNISKYVMILATIILITGCAAKKHVRQTIELSKPVNSTKNVNEILEATKKCYKSEKSNIILEVSERDKYSKIRIYNKSLKLYSISGVITIFTDSKPYNIFVVEDINANLNLASFITNGMECKNEK